MKRTTTRSLFLVFLAPSLVWSLEDRRHTSRSQQRWSWAFWRRDDSSEANRNVPELGYYDPSAAGGSMLTQVDGTDPPDQHEPLNVIVTGLSEEAVLVDQEVDGGLRNYFASLHFSGECLGQHEGNSQRANLGDGNGYKNESAVIRWNYFDPSLGSCRETIDGGNHFRYWVQDGSEANSGSIFMAASYEMPLNMQHDIVSNGYNLGRDWIVGNITNSTVPTAELTNSSRYSGYTWAAGWTYYTDVTYVSGLLENSSFEINHNWSVSTPTSNAVDGLVAVLRVAIHEQPDDSSAFRISPPALSALPFLMLILASTL